MPGIKKADKLLRKLTDKRKFYERVAKKRGDTNGYWAVGFNQSLLIKKVNEILQGVHHQQIIDVGCGDGRTALYLAQGNNSVMGIDISHTRLSSARKKLQPYAPASLFIQSYAEKLPLKGEIFDGAVCTEVLEHVLNEDALLSGLFSVLKPNAWVLLSIPTVSLGRYFDMRYTKQLIYYDPIEHLREYTYQKIPPFENDFILVKDLIRKIRSFGLIAARRYGVGFELPLGVRRFKIGRLLERIVRNERINTLITSIPFIRNFVVYSIFILHKVPQRP